MTIAPLSAVGVTDPTSASSVAGTYDQMVAGLGTSDVGSIEDISIPGVDSSFAAGQAATARSDSFGNMLGQGLRSVENLDVNAQTKAIGAATGDLNEVHDYVIAAVKAQTAVELTTTLRNKALESFQQIMGMQL